VRKDGQHPIVLMQCGPIRFKANDKKEAEKRPFAHRVKIVHTLFSLSIDESKLPTAEQDIPIQDVFRQLCENEPRNILIAEKALDALAHDRSPVLLTERRRHLDWFKEYLENKVDVLIVLHGGMGAKKRRMAWELLQNSIESKLPHMVLATGKYLGEGFDDASLDTLLLAMPVSWRGTIAQYAGRLHRLYDSKKEVIIYDFLDDKVPVLQRMYDRRCKGYSALGYVVEDEASQII